MVTDIAMHRIARIHTDFPTKFGIPRQSGVVEELKGEIIFEPEYRNCEALRGLDGFSHIWLVWLFSESMRGDWSPTVRPPRLGGNTRMGVFATRSPFRPNAIGLSCVKLEHIDLAGPEGPLLTVSGIDMMDGTPILDMKPYLPYADCHTEATEGFTASDWMRTLSVNFPSDLLERVPASRRTALIGVLANDPRPSYQHDSARVYGLPFADLEIKFRVDGGILTVLSVEHK